MAGVVSKSGIHQPIWPLLSSVWCWAGVAPGKCSLVGMTLGIEDLWPDRIASSVYQRQLEEVPHGRDHGERGYQWKRQVLVLHFEMFSSEKQ